MAEVVSREQASPGPRATASFPDELLVVNPGVSFRFLDDGVCEVSVGGRRQSVPADVVRLAAEFSASIPPRQILDRVEGAERGDVLEALRRMVDCGVLLPSHERPAAGAADDGSLLTLLRPGVLDTDQLRREVGAELRQGGVCMIENALREDFAEKIFDCLDEFEDWRPHERHVDFFGFRHHNIYDTAAFPDDLASCFRVFDSAETKRLVSDVSGADCSGECQFSASYYLPGDYSTPHDDARPPRAVAFVWHLTKDWNASWGGHFVWCSPPCLVAPSFNTLVIFDVRKHESMHFVAPVSPLARGKRLAVNGWWTSPGGHRTSAGPGGEGPRPCHPPGTPRTIVPGIKSIAATPRHRR